MAHSGTGTVRQREQGSRAVRLEQESGDRAGFFVDAKVNFFACGFTHDDPLGEFRIG